MTVAASYRDNITDAVAKAGGAVHIAPAGTNLPTDASTALGSDFKKFHSKKDGATFKKDAKIVPAESWEDDDAAELSESTTIELTINPIEDYMLNESVAKLMFPSDDIVIDAVTNKITGIKDGDGLPDECVLVIETLTKKGAFKKRIVIPRFQPYSQTDEVLKKGTVTVPQITGKCLRDDSGYRRYNYIAAAV